MRTIRWNSYLNVEGYHCYIPYESFSPLLWCVISNMSEVMLMPFFSFIGRHSQSVTDWRSNFRDIPRVHQNCSSAKWLRSTSKLKEWPEKWGWNFSGLCYRLLSNEAVLEHDFLILVIEVDTNYRYHVRRAFKKTISLTYPHTCPTC